MATDLPRRSTPLEEAAEELAVRTSRFSPHPSIDVLGAYRAAELAEEEAERVRAHLAACPRCTEVLLDLARLDGELDDEHAPELTEADLDERWQRLEARIRRENPKEARGPAPPSNKHWQALAAGLFLAVLGLGSWSLSLMSENRRWSSQPTAKSLEDQISVDIPLFPTSDPERGTRGAGKEYVVRRGYENVHFSLRLPESAPGDGDYVISISKLEGERAHPVFSRRGPFQADADRFIAWTVAARDVPPGAYGLRLDRATGAGYEHVAAYDFRIVVAQDHP